MGRRPKHCVQRNTLIPPADAGGTDPYDSAPQARNYLKLKKLFWRKRFSRTQILLISIFLQQNIQSVARFSFLASVKISFSKNKTRARTQKIDPERPFGYKCARHEDYGS